MKKGVVIIIAILFLGSALYFSSFLLFTNKYMVLYTSNTCDIARTVSYEWQRNFYYPAAVIELSLVGKPPHKPVIQIDTPELHQYFNEQWSQCRKIP